jgi:hypothetical protein
MTVTYDPVRPERVLAIDPVARGFGFVVLEEEPLRLLDWGVTSCRKKGTGECVGPLNRLVVRYEPTVLVLEDPQGARASREAALVAFMATTGEVIEDGPVPVELYPRSAVRDVFIRAGARTKIQIVELLANRFPELRPRVPPRRQVWEGEDSRMSIFDALSLALAHLSVKRENRERVG